MNVFENIEKNLSNNIIKSKKALLKIPHSLFNNFLNVISYYLKQKININLILDTKFV